LYSDDVWLYLSGKNSGSNPFRITQVYLSLYAHRHTQHKTAADMASDLDDPPNATCY